jgi:hypothetical protein
VPPELALSVSADSVPKALGDQFTYAFKLVNNAVSGSDSTVLTVHLPAGVQVDGFQSHRGPGCTLAGLTLTCPLDFFPGKYSDTVYVMVKAIANGDLVASGSVWSTPTDSNAANDTASLTLHVGAAPANVPPAPARPVRAPKLTTTPCVVPSVVGKTLAAAKARLAQASCSTGTVTRTRSNRGTAGRVVAQSPRAGTRVSAHGRVQLVVGRSS